MSRIVVCEHRARLAAAGCISAPEIVLVDRATALEQQAAGSFRELEKKLARAAHGAAAGAADARAARDARHRHRRTLVDDTERTDADRVDELLKQHCIGEAKDGTLVDTHDACKGAADRAAGDRCSSSAPTPRASSCGAG